MTGRVGRDRSRVGRDRSRTAGRPIGGTPVNAYKNYDGDVEGIFNGVFVLMWLLRLMSFFKV